MAGQGRPRSGASSIEADPCNYSHLAGPVLSRYGGARGSPGPGTFDEHLPEIARLARRNTVFLYVDPYDVQGPDLRSG